MRNPMPVLAGILFEATGGSLYLSGTDLELGICCRIPCDVIEPGAAVLPAKYITELVRRLPDVPLFLKLDPETGLVMIKYGDSEAYLNSFPAEDFPGVSLPEGGVKLTLSGSKMRDCLRRVVYAADTDENHPIYSGVLFEIKSNCAQMVATDTYRLAWSSFVIDSSEELDIKIIIPGKTLNEILRITGDDDTVCVTITGNNISFQLDNVYLVSRLVAGDYPNYKIVIPEKFSSKITFKTKAILEASDRALLFSIKDGSRESSYIKLSLDGSLLTVSANTVTGRLHEQYSVLAEGEPFHIAFNARYLGDALRSIGSEDFSMEISGPLSPAVLKPVGRDDHFSVLLPVRVRSI